jgi:hypothetical protein
MSLQRREQGEPYVPDELLPLVTTVDVRELLKDATASEAQLALSLIVWPKQAPDPRVVDEWVRLHTYSTPKRR